MRVVGQLLPRPGVADQSARGRRMNHPSRVALRPPTGLFFRSLVGSRMGLALGSWEQAAALAAVDVCATTVHGSQPARTRSASLRSEGARSTDTRLHLSWRSGLCLRHSGGGATYRTFRPCDLRYCRLYLERTCGRRARQTAVLARLTTRLHKRVRS